MRGVREAARALGLPKGADFRLRSRDPRQDLQYGESLLLCEDPKPYRLARARLKGAGASAQALLLRGAVECVLGSFKPAERLLARAASLDASLGDAWLYLGVARSLECRRRRTQEGLADALAALDRAVALGAEGALAWRAELRHDLEDHAGALADVEAILARDAGDLWARVERGEILCETGRHEQALSEFDRLVAAHPRASWAYALRGRTLATTGREAESLPDLRRAARLAPRSGAARAWLSESLRKLGRYAEARDALDAALRLEPGYTLAWVWRGRLRLLAGDARGAAADLSRALALDRRYGLAFAWRAEANLKLGRRAAARRDAARARPLDLSKTWNAVVPEGEPLTPQLRRAAFEREAAGTFA